MQSFRPLLSYQQYGSDGSSPVQLSFSNRGQDNSLPTASSSCVSSYNRGIIHSTILDAPLQAALVPPPHPDEWPLFSFGNSFMHSSPLTPTLPSSTSRHHSIYHDAMIELACNSEVESPFAMALSDDARTAANAAFFSSAAYSYKPKLVRGIGTTSFGNISVLGASPSALLHSSALSVSNEDRSLSNKDIPVDTWSVDGGRPHEKPSPTSLSLGVQWTEHLYHQAAESPNDDASILDHERADIGLGEEESEEAQQCWNKMPDVLASTQRCTQNGYVSDRATETEVPTSHSPGPQAVTAPLDHPVRLQEAKVNSPTLSETGLPLARNHGVSRAAAATSVTVPFLGTSCEKTKPLDFMCRSKQRSTAPAGAPTSATADRSTTDLRLYMPSPTEQSPHVFGTVRDSAAPKSSSEQSVSILSLVPAVGVWHPSTPTPTAALGIAHCLQDLLEMLRLLQSDMNNVRDEISVGEHSTRRWIRSTLSLLLQFTAELVQSVSLAAVDTTDNTKEQAATYTELKSEMTAEAASIGLSLLGTIEAVEREQEKLEPLLLTTMLARRAIKPLLQLAGKRDVTARRQSAAGITKKTSITSCSPKECSRGNSGHESAPPNVVLLTPEVIEELMDNKTLQDELNNNWPKFSSTYNRHMLRYACLRTLYILLCEKEDAADAIVTERRSCGTDTHVEETLSTSASLETLVSDWVEEQLLHRTAPKLPTTPQERHVNTTTTTTTTRFKFEDVGQMALYESLCRDFPTFERVAEVFTSFRDGECWRWWYSLLDHAMSWNFQMCRNKHVFDYVKKELMSASSAPAVALQTALANHDIIPGDVLRMLEEVKPILASMEQSGKAQRYNILQRILHRIFALSLVTLTQRTLGKDTPPSGAQLGSHAHLQGKLLADVEAQLTAHQKECSVHIKHLKMFLTLFPVEACTPQPPSKPTPRPPGRSPAVSGKRTPMGRTRISVKSISLPDSQSELSTIQWNSPIIMSIAMLFTLPRTEMDATYCSNGPLMANKEDVYIQGSAEDRTRAAVSLTREVMTQLVKTVQGLCEFLLCDADSAGLQKMYRTPPTRITVPSTRALRRLQASLSEANYCIRLCMASLRSLD